ncbi:MAG: ABC transporter ATP-binding protein [Gammaproteobacteria bacterium]|nr:ABC transporter ATP-binding protein [Gammaproteobacteria bacterium]
MADGPPLIALEDVTFRYPDRPVLAAVDFHIHAGERVAVVGPNGSGKSTLLQLMVGLHRPQAGHITAFGRPCRTEQEFRAMRRRVGLLFQDSDDQLFCPTVEEDVAFGPLNLGLDSATALARAHATLGTLGLDTLAGRVTHRLSGGEKRLVALAAVLAMEPEVLLLDEPTNGLDTATEERLTAHLESLPQAMVFVSHDNRLLARMVTRAVLLHEGRLHAATMHSHPHTHAHLHIHAPGVPADHRHGAPPHSHPHEAKG